MELRFHRESPITTSTRQLTPAKNRDERNRNYPGIKRRRPKFLYTDNMAVHLVVLSLQIEILFVKPQECWYTTRCEELTMRLKLTVQYTASKKKVKIS